MAALDAIRAAGLKAKSNIKFVFEGEEEAYSFNLDKILGANKELFSGDVWLIVSSAPCVQSPFRIKWGAGFGQRNYSPTLFYLPVAECWRKWWGRPLLGIERLAVIVCV